MSARRYSCSTCDEVYESALQSVSGAICRVCGSPVTQIQQSAPRVVVTHDDMDRRVSDEERSGLSALQEAIQHFLEQQERAQLEVNAEIVQQIAVLKVDDRMLLLRDCVISVSELTFSAILSTFSFAPDPASDASYSFSECVRPADAFAETPMYEGMEQKPLVIVDRGKVSFARKAFNCCKAGAMVVAQTSGYQWPFQAADSAKELARLQSDAADCTSFPVLTIRESDATLLLQFLRSERGQGATIRLLIHALQKECVICRDEFAVGDDVMKLPCRHLFHQACLTQWLERHSQCPMCRGTSLTAREALPPTSASRSRGDQNQWEDSVY